MQSRKIKLAIFDIDGTIFRSSLLIELVEESVQQGIFPKESLKEIKKDFQAWLDRKGSYENYIMRVVDVYAKNIVGKKVSEMNRITKNVIDEQKDRMYRFTRDLISDLRSKKYYLVAVSGSPHEIVTTFVKTMNFDAAFGTLYEVRNGRYTGKITLDNTVRNKGRVISLFLEDYGLQADFKNSLAVGDTEGDITTLELVGNPIAFNPNQGLLRVAKAKKWRIVVERKDVILEVEKYKALHR